ncbi:hypothetical protein ACOMHN_010904 [Nucella lapillus]
MVLKSWAVKWCQAVKWYQAVKWCEWCQAVKWCEWCQAVKWSQAVKWCQASFCYLLLCPVSVVSLGEEAKEASFLQVAWQWGRPDPQGCPCRGTSFWMAGSKTRAFPSMTSVSKWTKGSFLFPLVPHSGGEVLVDKDGRFLLPQDLPVAVLARTRSLSLNWLKQAMMGRGDLPPPHSRWARCLHVLLYPHLLPQHGLHRRLTV